jgi:putative nucleotidyltransferase with HDIG domain
MHRVLQPKQSTKPSSSQQTKNHQQKTAPIRFIQGIRFKLTLFVLALIACTTFSVAMIVIKVMNQSLLQSLFKRGSAITQAASTPAGYSLLINDRLALDNLTAQIEQAQTELEYVVILNLDGKILAHSHLDQTDRQLPLSPKTIIETDRGLTIANINSKKLELYEFRRSIIFAGKEVGSVVIGINTLELVAAKAAAHRDILLIAAIATIVGLLGAIILASIMTRPIEQLTEGVAKLHKGEQVDIIPIRSHDELGILTENFNSMAATIRQQNESLQNYATELKSSYGDMVRILAAALDARDNYTYGHSARVAHLALALGERLHLGTKELKELEFACLLHDIGKIHVPDDILNKKDKLSKTEQQQISKHPILGSQILELAPSLHKYIPTVKHHHERYDGTGYPDKLRGDDIPLHAQIVALADTYDAMTSSRPYRKGLSRHDAISEIRHCSGSQFNPCLTEPFIEIVQALPEEHSEMFQPLEILCAS